MSMKIVLMLALVPSTAMLPAALGAAGFLSADTAPPTVSVPRPSPDSTVTADTDIVISAGVADEGDGLNPSSLRLRVDDQDQSAQAQLTAGLVSWHPAQRLSKGI